MKIFSRRHLLLYCLALVALVGSVYGAPATAATVGTAKSGNQLAAADELPIGFVLVGPQDDAGWNQAHYQAAEYVEKNIPGTKKIILDKLNPADRPNITLDQVVENMVSEGAKLIFTTSDDFQDGTTAAAKKYPDVTFIMVSGDAVLKGGAPKNLGNVMG